MTENTHNCPNLQDIAVLKKQADDLERIVFRGNGKPSIQETVIALSIETKDLKESNKELKTAVRALTTAYSENTGAKEIKTEIRADKKWKISTIIGGLAALSAWIKVFFFTN